LSQDAIEFGADWSDRCGGLRPEHPKGAESDRLKPPQDTRHLGPVVELRPFARQAGAQPVSDEANPDMIYHAIRPVVIDRTHFQVCLEFAKGILDTQKAFVMGEDRLGGGFFARLNSFATDTIRPPAPRR